MRVPSAFAPNVYEDRLPALAPYAAAAWACYEEGVGDLHLRSSLGEDETFPVEFFFRTSEEFLPFERYALELARGEVLDVGAGAGPHALELQRRGRPVVTLEVCADLVRLQRTRGVRHAYRADFRFWRGPRFDTVLMLMNGLGPTGTLLGLDRVLRHARAWVSAGGQLLVDAAAAIPEPSGPSSGWPPTGGYGGQAWIELSHRGRTGLPFRELYVDLDTLGARAVDAGWRFEVAFEGEAGGYLARLTP